MKLVYRKKPPKRMSLFFIGDTHYPRGKRKIFQNVLHDDVLNCEYESRMIFMGDAVEGITHIDPRYDPEEMAYHIKKNGGSDDSNINMINEQWDMFESDMKEVLEEGVVDSMFSGTHESSLIKYQSRNDMKGICKRYNVDYLGNGYAVLCYAYKNKPLIILASHGQGGGITSKYVVGKLEDDAKLLPSANMVVRGHHHKLLTLSHIPGFSLSDKYTNIKANHQKLGCSGSFLGNYELGVTDYGERKGYHPLPIGYLRAEIDNGEILSFNEVIV